MRMDFPHSIEINNTQFMQINYKFGRYQLKYLINSKMFVPPEKVKCGSIQVLLFNLFFLKNYLANANQQTTTAMRTNEKIK